MDTPPEAATVLEHWREKMRKRREVALGFTEDLLHGESMDNVDADLLAALYNPAHPPFLNLYIRGKKHKDLRYFIRTRVGALPQLDSPEEVALINYDADAMDDGIWYLEHMGSELKSGTASSEEDRRLFATRSYKIETAISKNDHVFGTTVVTLQPLIEGERVLKFELLPNLRVTRVSDGEGQDLYFVQESRKEDGSFYVILPKGGEKGKEYSLTIQYEGDKVLQHAGDGSFYVRARSSWYPNLNGFGEHALYDLTYKVPRRYKVISVGKLKSESIEQDYAVSHWITPMPVAVAGFNYGAYTKLELEDHSTGYKISGYYLSQLPDNLRNYDVLRTMAPESMTKYALEQTRAQLQLCTYYFGKSPYDEIFITEQPDFTFGQSWPNLVYLPISAYTDSTQRWMLFGNINAGFSGFVREVTPHEVAHQWWGDLVFWRGYRDQWIFEGLASYCSLMMLERQDPVGFRMVLEKYRLELQKKNKSGAMLKDAGPVTAGFRLSSSEFPEGYEAISYGRGTWLFHMLRYLLKNGELADARSTERPTASAKAAEEPFLRALRRVRERYSGRSINTRELLAVFEEELPSSLRYEGKKSLEWFYEGWINGTAMPQLDSKNVKLLPKGRGLLITGTVVQKDAPKNLVTAIPLYGFTGKGDRLLLGMVFADGAENPFRVTAPAGIKRVVLDPDQTLLTQVR